MVGKKKQTENEWKIYVGLIEKNQKSTKKKKKKNAELKKKKKHLRPIKKHPKLPKIR
jgi:hypothetical protein